MGSYHVCKRAIFEHFQVSICTDFLPVSEPKEWFDCRLFAGGRYRRVLHYLRRLTTAATFEHLLTHIRGALQCPSHAWQALGGVMRCLT